MLHGRSDWRALPGRLAPADGRTAKDVRHGPCGAVSDVHQVSVGGDVLGTETYSILEDVDDDRGLRRLVEIVAQQPPLSREQLVQALVNDGCGARDAMRWVVFTPIALWPLFAEGIRGYFAPPNKC